MNTFPSIDLISSSLTRAGVVVLAAGNRHRREALGSGDWRRDNSNIDEEEEQ